MADGGGGVRRGSGVWQGWVGGWVGGEGRSRVLGRGGAVRNAGTFQSGQQFFITAFWLRAAAGEGQGSLKKNTGGFLFRLLLFHWRFPIYLSDQVIEDVEDVDL